MKRRDAAKAVWRQIDWKVVITSAVVAIVVQGVPKGIEVVRQALTKPPEIRLASLAQVVGPEWRVTDRQDADLDDDNVEEVIATAVRKASDKLGPPNPRVVIVGWDKETQRWAILFDTNDDRVSRHYLDEREDELVFPSDAALLQDLDLKLAPRPRGLDVVISANLHIGSTSFYVITRVRLEDEVAEVVFDHAALGQGAVELLSEPAGAMRVKLDWNPLEVNCCPPTDYHVEVAEREGYYQVVRDERPTAGLVLLVDERPRALVVRTVPGLPADGVLQPGDEIIGTPDIPDPEDGGVAKLFETLTRAVPNEPLKLTVRRSASLLELELRPRHRYEWPLETFTKPSIPDLGLSLSTGDPGAFVESVLPGSGAAEAGIPEGVAIVNVEGREVLYPADVWRVLADVAESAPSSVKITYEDVSKSTRLRRTVTVQKTYSADDGSWGPFALVVY